MTKMEFLWTSIQSWNLNWWPITWSTPSIVAPRATTRARCLARASTGPRVRINSTRSATSDVLHKWTENLSNSRHQTKGRSSTRHRPLSLLNPLVEVYWARSGLLRKPSTSRWRFQTVWTWSRKCSKEMARSTSATSLSTSEIESWSIKTFFGRSSGRRIRTARLNTLFMTALKKKNHWSDGTLKNSKFCHSRSWT